MDLKIPKIETMVELSLVDTMNRTEEFIFFLNQFSRFSSEGETVEEMLNSGQSFLPAKRVITGKVMIMNIAGIVYVKEKVRAQERGIRHVFIHFHNRFSLEVEIFEALPPFQARTLDFFNGRNTFLPFLLEGCRAFINKRKILRISET